MLCRLALICGFVPLLCSMIIGLQWIGTGWHKPALAEGIIIGVGITAFIAGLTLLALHFMRSRLKGSLTDRQARRQGLVSGAILLLNFLIASGLFFLAFRIVGQYCLTIENESDERLESIIISSPDIKHEYGPLAPGKKKQLFLKIQRNGRIAFQARQGGKIFQSVLESRACSGMGVSRRLVIKPGRAFIVVNESEASEASYQNAASEEQKKNSIQHEYK
ncbi:MAG: hypothetical protein WCQ99_13680 [Pseudomonadota bacterium]